ncbi:hypothetical protein pipiens_001804 [Culex pipiens pipiens]|uniref:PDZ domain-containing protein n=1 Tax=Culex pipiens pipiens TaxID=38569 RepID=A0ABD1DTJ3_CULPP
MPEVGRPILVTSSGLVSGPRLVVLHRHNGDFGFTLRHFIVYPPPDAHPPDPGADRLAAAAGMPNFAQPMDTVFVKKVHPNSPAFLAGLQEGDRLLAVNGLSVASLPYAQVVATIQQTPKTLTLQVVPKNYDLLQTYFSETAYNPETNQRPQPQQLFIPKASSTPTSHHRTSTGSGKRQVLTDVQEKQESLYSTLQEIVESAVAPTSNSSSNKPAAIYAEVPKIRSPPIAAEAPKPKPVVFDFDPIKQQQYLAQQKMLLQHSRDSDSISSYDSVKSAATLSANDVVLMGGGDSAIMSRLRKSFEQKEEFLRRPAPAPTSCAAASDVQQREFYGRPNRLQKFLTPTTTKMSSGTQTHAASLAAAREQHSSAMSAIREQFFAGTNGEPKSAPPSLLLIQQNQQLSGSQSALPLSPASMHVVSEKAKLFESGRPLSPDGVDRAELYKSELSRMNPKQVVPNVAVRRKEFELKAESTGWRRSTEEKPRSVSSDSESRRTPVRVRSLSVESSGSKDPMASLYAASTASSDDQQHSLPTAAKDAPGSCSLLRQRPVRENSYRHAVRNSTDSNQVVLRQKQQHQQPLTIEEDERKTRRISYLRATAHDNLLHMMESSAEPSVDSSPMSLPPDTPDTEPEVACGNGGAGGDQLTRIVPGDVRVSTPTFNRCEGCLMSQPLGAVVRATCRRFSSPSSSSQSTTANNSEPTTPTTPTNREFDDPSKFAAIVTDSDGEVGEEPAVAIRSAAGQRTAQKRSASLTTSSLGGAQLTGSSLGNLHVITTTSASGIVTRSYFFAQSHSAKSKALAHFRDAPADPSVPVTREGELNVKVTLIDGKRSQDRSWRTVHAELRGTRLRLTLLRDGKSSSSQVSRQPLKKIIVMRVETLIRRNSTCVTCARASF